MKSKEASRLKLCALALALALGAALLAPPLAAQTEGSVSGRVLGPNGSPIAEARVSATSLAQAGPARTSTSGADGRYVLSPLPPGRYRLSATAPGFAAAARARVIVGVHQDVTLDWKLVPVTVKSQIQVSAAGGEAVRVGRSDLGQRIPKHEIEELPLNGRNFQDLVTLVPGVKPNPGGVASEPFSIFGERAAATSFLVNGAENNDPINGGPLERYPQDSIAEFEVLTSSYSAEFGRAQGGIINVVTRSGTNRFKGKAFFFRRDTALDSSNVPGQPVAKLKRNQWGASLGGPIVRDKLFFFAAGEALDEHRGRNLDTSAVPAWVLSGLATRSGKENLNAGPSDRGRNAIAKIDWQAQANHHLFLSANLTNSDLAGVIPDGIAGALVLPSGSQETRSRDHSVELADTWLLSPNAYVDSIAQWTRAKHDLNPRLDHRAEAVLLLLPSGFIQTSDPLAGRTTRKIGELEARQTLSWFRSGPDGDHQFKVGYDLVHTTVTGGDQITNDVEYSPAFLDPNASAKMRELFQRFGFQQAAARFFFLSTQPDGKLTLDLKNTQVAIFGQDSWQPTENLTLNLGLRYDWASLFGKDRNNFAPRLGAAWDVGGQHRTIVHAAVGLFYDRNALAAAAGVPEKGGIFTRNLFDVALPRLGFTYPGSLIDLVITSGFPTAGGGHTPPENPTYSGLAAALRADPLALYRLLGIAVSDPSAPPVVTADNIQQLSGLTPDQAVALLEQAFPGTAWAFFDVPGGSIVGNRVLSFFPRGTLDQNRIISRYAADRTPWTRSFTIGVEQKIGDTLVASASYVRRRTRDLLTRRIVNLYDVPPGSPNFGKTTDGGPKISEVTYDGKINYDGVVLSLSRPFSDGFGFLLSYTYSRAYDNLLTGAVGSTFSNNNHPEYDWGPSNLSVPNLFVGSFNASLPWGMRLGSIVYWRSGNAFSPRGIIDSDGDGIVDQRDLSVPRNSLRVAPYFEIDMRLEKAFVLTGRASGNELDLLADVFNLTNRRNVSGVNSVSGPSFGVPNSFYPGREIQLGLRFSFGTR